MRRFILPMIFVASPALAGEADVIDATATHLSGDEWRVSATIRHEDEGWHHYAKFFDVMAPDGRTLGTRVLHHPHVEEQPFTRSVTVTIPTNITQVTVRAADSSHGTGGEEFVVELQR